MSVGAFTVFFCILLVCAFFCLYRLQQGPTAPDRTVAVDILGTLIVGFCALYALLTGKAFYLNIGIAWALLSFVGTIALAKYLEGKAFDE
ncbi:MAG: cation:proton antiporter [Planctomycetota bacterium]|jgi:multicomponent Na+:H+ antiporter subunit F